MFFLTVCLLKFAYFVLRQVIPARLIIPSMGYLSVITVTNGSSLISTFTRIVLPYQYEQCEKDQLILAG
jgi:hypothetical protein